MSLAPVEDELDLPPAVAGCVWRWASAASPNASPFHRHAELELNLALGGHATYLVGSARVRLVRRSLLWLHPAQHHILLEASPDFAMHIVVWKPDFLGRACRTDGSRLLLDDDPGEARIRRVGEEEFAALETLAGALEGATGEGLEWGLGFLLHRAQWAFGCADANGDEARAVHPCVERAARLLRDQVPPPALPQLARQVGLSPSRLSRLFKSQTGVSLTEFRARACHARALRLCEGDLPLGEIAVRAGFGSYAQFHRAFCGRSGANPASVRRNVQNGAREAAQMGGNVFKGEDPPSRAFRQGET